MPFNTKLLANRIMKFYGMERSTSTIDLEGENCRAHLQCCDKGDREKLEVTKARSRSRAAQARIREQIMPSLKECDLINIRSKD